jgi:hypothetical protein
MMNSKQHSQIRTLADRFVTQARRTGARISNDGDICQLLSSITDAARQGRARACDARGRSSRSRGFDVPDPQYEGNPIEQVRAFDDEDLSELRERIDNALTKPGKNSQLLEQLRKLLDAHLGRDDDDSGYSRAHGRAHRDLESAPSKNAYDVYEPTATQGGRDYLKRSRALAARATDRRPARGFLGKPAEPGSDMARMEHEAMWSFGMLG